MASRLRGATAANILSRPQANARVAAVARSAVARPTVVNLEQLEDRKLLAVSMISVGLGGAPANGDSGEASVSQDGRYVVFSSRASNLVEGDNNGAQDVFLRDRNAGTTTLISRVPGGAIGNADSFAPTISANGRYVAFASKASNLIGGDANAHDDVFRYDIQTNTIQLVSGNRTNRNAPANRNSGEPSISADGRFVSFTSTAFDLGAADGNGDNDVYRRDMNASDAGAVVLVSVRIGGGNSGNDLSFDSHISADGQFVSFRSDANNLVAAGIDNNLHRDTFLRNLNTNTTILVSANANGNSGNAPSTSNAVSGNGRYVTFRSQATDLVGNDTNNTDDVFLRDTQTGQTRLLSLNRLGTASARGASEFPWLSSDGSMAVFSSFGPDLVEGDANGKADIFLRDLGRGPITLLSATPSGAAANGNSIDPFVSADARFVVFTSEASDLVGGDTNGRNDVFIATAPEPTADNQAPTAAVRSVQEAGSPGAVQYNFTIDLADNVGLNTVDLGPLTVTKQGGGTMTATFVGVIGSGRTAVATYRIEIPGGLNSSHDGQYTVTTQANSIKDAASPANAIPDGTNIGSFNLTVGSANGPDLTGQNISKIPNVVQLGGSKKGKAAVRVINSGTQPMTAKAMVTTEFFLSDNQEIDAFDTKLGEKRTKMKLKVGKGKNVKARFAYPTNVGDGGFFLLAKIDAANTVSEANEQNNMAGSGTAIPVEQPRIDLSGSLVRPFGTLKPGGTGFSRVTVNNGGNVKFGGSPTLVMVISSDNIIGNGDDREVATVAKRLPIKPAANGAPSGKETTQRFQIPADLAPGEYFLAVKIDTQNEVSEPNESNNIAVTASPFTISA